MRFELLKSSIRIIPESPADEVYLESVLGLRAKNDVAEITRVAPYGLDFSWAYAEAKKNSPQQPEQQ